MKIEKQRLREIVEETIDKILSLVEDVSAKGELTDKVLSNEVGKIEFVTRERFNEWAERVWSMLIDSYANIGGLKSYRHYEDFCKKHPFIILVLGDNDTLLACATYRSTGRNDLKMTAVGCIQDDNGKLAIQQIIKDNIKNFHLRYWAEVSGPIEHWFKKHGGYPMPNVVASEILKVKQEDIIPSKEDEVHYDRVIGNGGLYTKMIFGCPSEDILEKVMKDAEHYMNFREIVNKGLKENIDTTLVQDVMTVIEQIYRAHEEDGLNELIPQWHEALTYSLNVLQNVTDKDNNVTTYIEYAEYLLDDMQLLELQPLNL